jgi:uncharacterized OsmC-like protein
MIPRTSKHSVVATHAGGEAFTVAVRGHTVRTDQPRSAGGTDSAPTPLELMSVGLAACVALYVHRFCVLNGVDACGVAVEVIPVWRADPGRIARFEVLLHLPETVSDHVAAQLEAVARSCPVHHTLGEGADIEVRILSARGSAPALQTAHSSAA